MAASFAAARIADPIEHSSALMGFLVGALVGLAVGVAVVAATVATGGAALAVVAAVGAGMASTGGMALLGERLGATFSSPCGVILPACSPNVSTNRRYAARAIADMVQCSKDGPAPIPIAEGSKTVFINNFPAARKGDRTVCDAKIADGSPNVRIGLEAGTYMEIQSEVPAWMNNLATGLVIVGSVIAIGAGAAGAVVSGGLCGLVGFGGQLAGGMILGSIGAEAGGKIGGAIGGERGEIIGEALGGFIGGFFGAKLGGRMAAGHPVDIATGELFTEETDFRVHGPLPLVWSRLWISSSTIEGALGSGWHHSYDMVLHRSRETGYFLARLADGRLAFFSPPKPERPALNSAEQMLLHTDGSALWLTDYDGVSYHFSPVPVDGLGHLTQVADANGNSIALSRNTAGHLTGITDSASRLFGVTCDKRGRIVAIDGPDPERDNATLRLVTYSYDAAGDLVEAKDARGSTFQYRYSNHLLVEERRRGGLIFTFVWDDETRGRHARCVDTWGTGEIYKTRLEYDLDAQTTTVTTARGATSHYRWNAIGKVEEEVDPLGGVTLRTYNEAGQLISMTGPMGEASTNTFDTLGRLIERTDAAGAVTRIEYALEDLAGLGHANPSRITGPNNASDEFTYDAKGNLLTHTDPTGRERRFLRDSRGLPTAIVDGEGVWRRFEWSAVEGALISEGSGRGAYVWYSYDRLGQVRELVRGEDAPVRFVRDPNGNLSEIRRPDGGIVTLEYDSEDRITLHRDPLGRETRWRYDGLPFPLEQVAADGSRFAYTYDSELNLVGLENPKREHYQLDYDLAGRLAREIGFDGRVLDYAYDLSGRLFEQWDAGRRTRFVRDPLGRLLEKVFANEPPHRFAWDPAGNLVLAENSDRRVEFGYDEAGRMIMESQDGHVLEHYYDLRGRRTETVLPDGRVIQVGYGEDDLFSSVTFDGQTVVELQRDKAGREIERNAGAIREIQTYDPQGRLVKQEGFQKGGAARSQVIFERSFGYDGTDAITLINDSRRGLKRYQYDACDRLLAVDSSNPEHFVIDPAGNILASEASVPTKIGEARGDRLLSFNDRKFEYDDHGNRICESRPSEGVYREYRYDAENQLIEVEETNRTGGRITRFGYDALGRRTWKARSELPNRQSELIWTRTNFLWNGNVLLSESNHPVDASATIYLFEPDSFRPLAQVRRTQNAADTQTYRYHLDHLGTPQELSDDDGSLVWAADLAAFGQVRAAYVRKVENSLRFQGQYQDAETSLCYSRFRYYAPNEGAFVQQDPIGLAGGVNSFLYVSNPLQWIDPFGLAGFGTGRPSHTARVTVTDPSGNIKYQDVLRSGGMTPEERALGFPRNTLATHTEARAMRQVPLQQGDTMVIEGQYEPCKPCRGKMNARAAETGAKIEYRWREDGQKKTWRAGGCGL